MIYKSSMELGNVCPTLKLSFNLILESSKDLKGRERHVLSHFSFSDKEYLRFNPHGYVTIDISRRNEKGGNWDRNNSINITKTSRYMLIRIMKNLFNKCLAEKNLYREVDGNLHIDTVLAEKLTITKPISSKIIRIQPTVCVDERISESDYISTAGFMIMINTPSNYCVMKHDEFTYLIDELNRVDYDALSVQLYNLAMINENLPCETFGGEAVTANDNYKQEPQKVYGQTVPSKDVIPDLK